MTTDDELAQLRSDNRILYEALLRTEDELAQAQQANEDLREGIKQALIAMGSQQERIEALEEVITAQHERISTLERQQAKDSHNSGLPPSSDRFVRPPKSLRTKSGKKPGGQPGHRGHHLRQGQTPGEALRHPVLCGEHCQQDLRAQKTRAPELRQVIYLPDMLLCGTPHRGEEKQWPVRLHLTH